jgi:hypothetical protein
LTLQGAATMWRQAKGLPSPLPGGVLQRADGAPAHLFRSQDSACACCGVQVLRMMISMQLARGVHLHPAAVHSQCIQPRCTHNASSRGALTMHPAAVHSQCIQPWCTHNASSRGALTMHPAVVHSQCIQPWCTHNASSRGALTMHPALQMPHFGNTTASVSMVAWQQWHAQFELDVG